MNRILKAIDKELRSLCVIEAHERFDGNHHEADRLRGKIAELLKLRNKAKEME